MRILRPSVDTEHSPDRSIVVSLELGSRVSKTSRTDPEIIKDFLRLLQSLLENIL